MRSLIFLLLLAGASAPALSQDRDGDGRPSRSERSERAERPSRAERMEARSQAREERSQARSQASEERREQRVIQVQRQSVETNAAAGVSERRPSAFGRQRLGVDIAPRTREIRTIPSTTEVRTPQTGVTQHRDRDGRRWGGGDRRRWDRDGWRSDRRYDWRRWRDRNRSIFRLGLYIDPFGYRYNRWGIGSRLYSNYYSSSYWINDPWMYRLPQAYPPYRWVRYHNDALLIDTWSGEVVDVIYNFFW